MGIREYMTHPAVTCPDGATLDVPARLMREFDCGAVAVVSDDGRLSGIITDRDVCMAAYAHGKPLGHIPVAKAMSKPVISIHGDDTVESAEKLMADNRVRRLPVVDHQGRPEGVIALDDLARLAARARKSGVDRELVEVLAAVTERGPRHVTQPPDGPVHARVTR